MGVMFYLQTEKCPYIPYAVQRSADGNVSGNRCESDCRSTGSKTLRLSTNVDEIIVRNRVFRLPFVA